MMNKLFMIVLSVCCLLMAACGTDNEETPQGLRIVDTDVDLAAGGGTDHQLASTRISGLVLFQYEQEAFFFRG